MSDYPFNQKTMKSLHERIEELEGKDEELRLYNSATANLNDTHMEGVYEVLTELCRAINDINHRLYNISQAVKPMLKEMPTQLRKEENDE
jgi:hypothetical protein